MAKAYSRELKDPPSVLASRFASLRDYRDVAALLEVDAPTLGFLLYRSPPSVRYHTYDVPKRRGGSRTISAPMASLKFVQRKLNQVLQAVYSVKPSVHGFVDEKSIISNADCHDRRRFVLNVDLENFFGVINFGRVRGMFMGKPYRLPERAATVLAQICCFNNQLPQGAPTSPVVSNMICGQLDAQLQRLARDHKLTYSRYADDLTFSGTNHVPSELGADRRAPKTFDVGPRLTAVISANGFAINRKKVRLATAAERQEVTGLVVNRKVNVPRKYIRQVRAMLHAWRKFGLAAAEAEFFARYDKKHRPVSKRPTFRRVVRGRLEFIGMVRGKDDPLFQNLLAQYDACVAPSGRSTPRAPNDVIRGALWVVEEDHSEMYQGTAFAVSADSLPEHLRVAVRAAGVEWTLITCDHCLLSGMKAYHPANSGAFFPVEVVARDNTLDLAVLAVRTASLGTLPLDLSATMTDGMSLRVAGFPNYGPGMTAPIYSGTVVGTRAWHGRQLPILDATIVAGMSGGPALNNSGAVIGVAVTGAIDHASAKATEKHGAVPIAALSELQALPKPEPL
ncbi:MAG: trypsin-like peptidase domain-containing protein [Labilithrix sp.]|nr:trypsin-like peptidase domain-containing protein [Labilithrix sp.]